jgi:signal peptidase I, bacterial type
MYNEKTELLEEKKKKKKKEKDGWFSVIILAILCVIMIFITNFVVKPVSVVGGSMNDTFHNKDLVLMYKWKYQPQRGDVVVIDKENPFNDRLFKRLIAVEGDHLVMQDGKVFVNGEEVDEYYLSQENQNMNTELDIMIPDGQIFIMGDNRMSSLDSRSFGPIDKSTVMGKIIIRIYPFTDFGVVSSN